MIRINMCCCCGGGNGRSTILSGESEKSTMMMMAVPRRPLSIDLNKPYEEEEEDVDDHYHHPSGSAAESSSSNRRKPAVPWTKEEHKAFLRGLSMLGKGNWKGISTEFVTTRTPAQVASHAQKYFRYLASQVKAKRRSSIFDIALPPIVPQDEEEEEVYDDSNVVGGLAYPPPPPPHYSWAGEAAAAAAPSSTHVSLGAFTARPRPMSNMVNIPPAPHTSFRPPRLTPAPAAAPGRSATSSPFNLFK